MNRTVRKVAERLRKRNEFDDLLNIYERDRGAVTLPARMAVNALASFEHADAVTAELNVQQTRRVAAAQATQAPKGPPPGMPGDAARVLYPQPHHGGAGGGQPPPGGSSPDFPMAPPGQPDYPMGTSRPPPPAPGAGGVGVMRVAGAAGVAPPAAGGSSNAPPSTPGGPPPPPAPGAGGVGIKRRAGRASGSTDPMVMEESSYYGGPQPPPPGAGAIAAQIMTGVLQQSAMAQEAEDHHSMTILPSSLGLCCRWLCPPAA